jgi:hypothetical protein
MRVVTVFVDNTVCFLQCNRSIQATLSKDGIERNRERTAYVSSASSSKAL